MRSLLLLVLLAPRTCWAQLDSNNTRSVGDDGLIALRAVGHVASAPLRWNGSDWLRVGGVAAATGMSFLLDDEGSDLMSRNRSSFNNGLSNVVVEYGTGYFAAGFPIAMYLSGLALHDGWIRETAVLMGATVFLTSTTTTVVKIAVGRARPYADFGNHEFHPFRNNAEFKSFPSGHATTAFAISGVLAARIKNPWATVGLYGLATLTSLSRMYSRDHWLSDVVFAGLYSSAVARSVVRWFENDQSDPSDGFSVTPTPNGVNITFVF